jgi:signal transduction histidine kinase/FixJ family two-component response regulator
MAASHDRRALTRAQPGLSWLGVVGFALVVALLAVALVQARQFSLLRQVARAGDEYAVINSFEAEVEYLRLREAWRQAGDTRTPLDPAALKLRYDIWVSRIMLLESGASRRVRDNPAEVRRALAQTHGFIAAADRALGASPEAPPSQAFVAAALPALEALAVEMHDMKLHATQRMAERLDRRTDAVRTQNQLGLGLTVFLSVLTLAFALIALGQVRHLRARRSVLEHLATNLRQARREAEAASAAKSAFLANMSHEIRTPFHGLMGMLALLRESGLTPHQIDYLRTATESADHLLAILNDILDLSQLESGRMTLALTSVDARALLRDVEALMRPQANAKALTLHFDTTPGVPERMWVDAQRFKQILFNLLSNAIKFSDQGTVMLEVAVGTDAQGAPEVEFKVTDTGIGMDEATLARLFTRFAPGDISRSRRHGGAGLGLEISRNLARLMGGDIQVKSQPGMGSSFSLRLPLKAVEDPASAPAPDIELERTSERPLRVLVAEDHPVNRQYMAALLEGMGHEAHFAVNGQEAVQAAVHASQGQRFDLVLMDLHMPVLDGVGATIAIRALPDASTSTVPIVALTADALDETRERCLVAGMNDFLTKPVSAQDLATSLRRLFGPGAAHAVSAADAPSAGTAHAGESALIDAAAVRMVLQAMPRDKLADMIAAFLDQGPATVQRLRAAVRDAQPLDLRVNAHAVKGAALNLGLAGLAATAEALQEGASHLPAHEIARLVQRYESQLPLTRAAAQAAGLLPTASSAPPATR